MKGILTSLFLLFLALQSVAQQPVQYSLYMQNKYGFNPAYAGMDNTLILTVAYRKQWIGLPGNPVNQTANAHMPLYIAGGGVGLALENETIGSWKQTSTHLTFSRQSAFSNGILSFGLSAGILQRQIDGSKVRTPGTIFDDLGNPVDHQDVLLSTGLESGRGAAFHAGAFYQSEKLEVGISAQNLLESEVDLGALSFKPKRTYYLFLGYQLDLGRSITVNPTVMLKSDISQTQIEFSLLTMYNENISAGASFRGYNAESLDAVALLAGFKLSEKISLYYAYDLTLSNLNIVSSGSHELVLNYNLGKPIGKGRPPKIIYNPRSL